MKKLTIEIAGDGQPDETPITLNATGETFATVAASLLLTMERTFDMQPEHLEDVLTHLAELAADCGPGPGVTVVHRSDFGTPEENFQLTFEQTSEEPGAPIGTIPKSNRVCPG